MYPVKSVYITTPFGKPGSVWAAGKHTGTDFRAAVGTPIYATRGGRVVHAGWGGSYGSAYGCYVVLSCRTRIGVTRQVLYAHLTRDVVYAGQTVKMGQLIGYSGSTGNTFGPHLHYEERKSPFNYWAYVAPVFLGYKPIIRPKVSLRKVQPGKRNRHIKKVQRHLNRRLGTSIPATGYYGAMTIRAAKLWQTKLGYTGKDADGALGRHSLEHLGFKVVA